MLSRDHALHASLTSIQLEPDSAKIFWNFGNRMSGQAFLVFGGV
jgi:hypothetical protein